MFTGLVSAVARVVSLRAGAAGTVLAVAKPEAFEDVAAGESIAVSGVCLTVLPEAAAGRTLVFDVSPETLSRSSLGALAPGAGVNLERALRASDRLGGHVVAGHVDGTAEVLAVETSSGSWIFRFSLPAPLARYVVEKGSIAVDGISLTVSALGEGRFDVAVIPHTYTATTLKERRIGDAVNLEVDVLGKYVERILEARLGSAREDAEARDERLRGLLTNGA